MTKWIRADHAQAEKEAAPVSVQEAARVLLKVVSYDEDAVEIIQTQARPAYFISVLRVLAAYEPAPTMENSDD